MSKRSADQDAADKIRGEAAFHRNNSMGYAEAVRQGLIPPNASPLFVEAYKNQQGNLEGTRLRSGFTAAYNQWDGRNSDDPEEFQNFLQDFIANSVTTDDPDILAGLNPHLQGIAQSAYDMHTAERGRAVYSGAISTNGALAGELIDQASDEGLSTGQGTDYDQLWGQIADQREEAISTGILEADYDKTLVEAITAKAVEHGDPELLQMLDRQLPGHDYSLSSYPEYRDIKASAMDELERMNNARMKAMDDAQKKIDQEREDTIVRTATRVLVEDPNAEVPEDIMQEWEKYDPQARATYLDIRKKLLEGGAEEDPQELLLLHREISEGAGNDRVNQAVQEGIIRSHTEYKRALDAVDKYAKSRKEGGGILKGATQNRFRKIISTRTAPDGLTDPFGTKGLNDEGLQATQDFENMLLDWELANPNASQVEIEKAVNEIGELVIKRIDSDSREYTSTEEMQQQEVEASRANENKLQELTAKEDERRASLSDDERAFEDMDLRNEGSDLHDQAAPTSTVDIADIPEAYRGDYPPDIEDLTKEQQEAINQQALSLGISPKELNERMWKKLKALGAKMFGSDDYQSASPGQEENTSGVPEEQQPQETVDPVKSASPRVRQAAPVLNLIGKTEGTDKGRGYNETLGYGKFTGGDVELTSMTLDEIDALQTKMLRHPKNNLNSSALGRYQVVRKTLRELRKKMGLKGSQKFTKELQDDIALALLERRGLSKWESGEISNDKFMANLAKEWASLPTPKGVSHYGGQRTGARPKEVLTTLMAYGEGAGSLTPGQPAEAALREQISDDYAGGIEVPLRAGVDFDRDSVARASNAATRGAKLMDIADDFLGYSERDPQQAKVVAAFMRKAGGASKNLDPAKTAWCAAFVNGVLAANGHSGTNALNARSFLNWGEDVTSKPTQGDVVVLWRESRSSWKGHVGLYHGTVTIRGKKYVELLGGNQNDKVSIARYPADRVLGVRRPKDMAMASTN
ncbi:MAG: hypothetical protein JJ891_06845 [Rhizobiaceae bacterium]|nr:hypothetical protein [Rhizobiaceae bacterium]